MCSPILPTCKVFGKRGYFRGGCQKAGVWKFLLGLNRDNGAVFAGSTRLVPVSQVPGSASKSGQASPPGLLLQSCISTLSWSPSGNSSAPCPWPAKSQQRIFPKKHKEGGPAPSAGLRAGNHRYHGHLRISTPEAATLSGKLPATSEPLGPGPCPGRCQFVGTWVGLGICVT